MKVIIVAHPTRTPMVEALQESLPDSEVLWDRESRGARWNHLRALKRAASLPDRTIIMEDDALPVPWFLEKARIALRGKEDELVSFYLGTGRPPHWQKVIKGMLDQRDQMRSPPDHILLPQLIHGVCYSIPSWAAAFVLKRAMESTQAAADYTIGTAWVMQTKRPVVYTVPSLVDHADVKSVEKHPDGQPRTEVRKAWRL